MATSKTLEDYCKENNKEYILEEWNYTLNRNLTPKDVSYGAGKRVYWKCGKCGETWIASINNRIRGSGCLACAISGISVRRSTPKGNSLAEKCPDIAKEWILEKNGDLKPENVTYKSHKRAWFRCSNCNYEWETRVENRVNFGCPKCKNIKTGIRNETPLPGQSLKDLFPEISKEWDYSKNSIVPDNVRPYSEKIVWWKCSVCGHSYKRIINVRTIENAICPKCSAKGTSYGEQYIYWFLKEIFDNVKNRIKIRGMEYDITVDDDNTHFVVEYSGINWHHEKELYDNTKRNIAIQNGFDFFEIIETWRPKFNNAKCYHFEYAPQKNRDEVLRSFIKQIVEKYGKSVDNVNLVAIKKNALDYSKGCVEKEKSLAFLFPKISLEWDYESNYPLTPENVTAYSGNRVNWKCNNGHEWISTISGRTKSGNGCPYCSQHSSIGVIKDFNDLASVHPELVSYWDFEKNGDIKPTQIRAGSHMRAYWKCSKCGYNWDAIVTNKVKAKNLCPQCDRGITMTKKSERKYNSSVGVSKKMNCGMVATIIEDFGYYDITIKFEDGLIRYHCRKDRFNSGKIAHKQE